MKNEEDKNDVINTRVGMPKTQQQNKRCRRKSIDTFAQVTPMDNMGNIAARYHPNEKPDISTVESLEHICRYASCFFCKINNCLATSSFEFRYPAG